MHDFVIELVSPSDLKNRRYSDFQLETVPKEIIITNFVGWAKFPRIKLDKLLQKDRHNRYHSATEVFTALQTIAQQNPTQNASPSIFDNKTQLKSLRGGCWNFEPIYCRSAIRFYYDWQESRDIFNGFRVVCLSRKTTQKTSQGS